MQASSPLGEERIAHLLSKVPAAPGAWVERAARIPRVQRDLEDVQRRLDEDALLRAAFEEHGEQALREVGVTVDDEVLAHLEDSGRQDDWA
jgi:hypothetical protein